MNIVVPQFTYIYIACGVLFLMALSGIVLPFVLQHPTSVDEQTMKQIGDNFCYQDCQQYTLMIYESATQIGDNFCGSYSCNSATIISLYNVTEIGDNFCNNDSCISLLTLSIPNLQTVGINFCGTFSSLDCINLQNIIISSNTSVDVLMSIFGTYQNDITINCVDDESWNTCISIWNSTANICQQMYYTPQGDGSQFTLGQTVDNSYCSGRPIMYGGGCYTYMGGYTHCRSTGKCVYDCANGCD